MSDEKSGKAKLGFFVSLRVILGIVIAVACLWIGAKVIGFFTDSSGEKSSYQKVVENNPALKKVSVMFDNVIIDEEEVVEPAKDAHKDTAKQINDQAVQKTNDLHVTKTETETKIENETETVHKVEEEIKSVKDPENDFGTQSVQHKPSEVRGSSFASALIKPLDYELNKRTLGWRPNDIFSFFTDNIANYQLGVLEVTRRSSITLVERIARTGSTITFDRNLDSARTKFMNDPGKYWLPSPEKAYKDALDQIGKYRDRLNNGKATFHARADNLVPLLEAFENLLGDCDEGLVKRYERNGAKVSTFKADNYYYYAKGVASAMGTILHAVMEDFGPVLESRGASADLHHAILMLNHATELNPLFIQESNLSGLFANHRANMAASISHARSYVQFVIKTMTT